MNATLPGLPATPVPTTTALMYTADDRRVPLEALQGIPPVFSKTRSYTPVKHSEMAEVVLHRARLAGLKLLSADAILARKGAQLFGIANFEWRPGQHLALGFRNSTNKTLSLGICSGLNVTVCSNLMFSGRDATYMRKHTGTALLDFADLVTKALHNSRKEARVMGEDLSAMRERPLSLDEGYATLGRAWGNGVLAPHQISVAMDQWKQPAIEEHAERNVWGLYQAVTQGLKKGAPSIGGYAKAHQFLMAAA